MSSQAEMRGFYKFLKERELSKERDLLLARLALSIMSPRDFMDEYPRLHERIQPIGVEFQVYDTVKSDCGFIGYITNFSGNLFEVKNYGEQGGSRNFSKKQLKHFYAIKDELRHNPSLNTFMEGFI
jgi:hypothetical protein